MMFGSAYILELSQSQWFSGSVCYTLDVAYLVTCSKKYGLCDIIKVALTHNFAQLNEYNKRCKREAQVVQPVSPIAAVADP